MDILIKNIDKNLHYVETYDIHYYEERSYTR
jgi:hypothetical protein